MTPKAKKRLRALLRVKQRNKCCYCERPLGADHSGNAPQPDSATLEHLLRQADGGKSNHDNLAVACFDCNVNRGNLDWLTYKSLRMGELVVV